MKIVLLIPVAFCSCASVTVKYPPSLVQGKEGATRMDAPVAYKASGIDRLPLQDMVVTRDSISITEHMPPNWPTQRSTTYNKDGSVTVNENPLYASNASNTTNAIHNVWAGVAKNLAGLAASAWTAIALGGQATSAQIASTKADAHTANLGIKSAASVEKVKILAPLRVP